MLTTSWPVTRRNYSVQQSYDWKQRFLAAINNIGLIKYEQGDVEAALKQWQAALAIDKQAAEPQMAMAVALYTKGDRKQSLAMGEASA